MCTDGLSYHPVIGGNDKRRMVEEQEQSDCFQRGDSRVRQTPVEVIDEDNQRHFLFFQHFLELTPQVVDFFGRGSLDRGIDKPLSFLCHFLSVFDNGLHGLGIHVPLRDFLRET
ncbi:MAG: hypothetical protein BWY07_02554 [Candidatus Hydrogenedentes bacterium ADurb.Bin170]|nr:MAG: hypothetical protein BWY07_02554 [Candidatus Hydrogenedentes bacterium ADurb.Bin170]